MCHGPTGASCTGPRAVLSLESVYQTAAPRLNVHCHHALNNDFKSQCKRGLLSCSHGQRVKGRAALVQPKFAYGVPEDTCAWSNIMHACVMHECRNNEIAPARATSAQIRLNCDVRHTRPRRLELDPLGWSTGYHRWVPAETHPSPPSSRVSPLWRRCTAQPPVLT